MHKNKTIIRNDYLCDDLLRCDAQLKVVHCSTAWNSMLFVTLVTVYSKNCGTVTRFQHLFHFLGAVRHFRDAVPQVVELFYFVSVFLDTPEKSKDWIVAVKLLRSVCVHRANSRIQTYQCQKLTGSKKGVFNLFNSKVPPGEPRVISYFRSDDPL